HFAPQNKTYLLFRSFEEEVVVHIINKNDTPFQLELDRFEEVGLKGKTLKNIITGETFVWDDVLELKEKGSLILTTKI
uniref:cyclomaltodextrinase C-terminal domain-containing protein n=1 Tax=Seonamhaeicola sp. TaxID=1912245 RepID=UPI0035620C26